MSQPELYYAPIPRGSAEIVHATKADTLSDVLERVLDKGVVIAGDIAIRLMDIELLTIHLRLLVASVEKAKEMGIDWWEHNPFLSQKARGREERRNLIEKEEEIKALKERVAQLESSHFSSPLPVKRKTRKGRGERKPMLSS
ncbi:MAG TPA: gas vesicle protein [Candidatus Binatia bacterium]|jgi:hypothetical protein|nr:gas vesicle protein [Candidatus Binatia bacterium]